MADKYSAILGQYVGKSCEADVHNNNNMNLSSELFDTIVNSDEYKRAIKNGHYIGYLGHPDDPDYQHYQDGCIVLRSMKRVGKDIEGVFDLIATPVGKIVKTFIDAGINFGISIRGAGDVDEEGYVNPDTFIFRGFDLVGFPAYDDCIPKFREIAASTDITAKSNYKKICAVVKENLQYITSATTIEALQSQFNETDPEYAMLGDRLAELTTPEGPVEEVIVDEQADDLDIAVMQQKLEGVTDLYLQERADKLALAQELLESQAENIEIAANYNRKLAHLKRITCNQVRDLRKSKEKVVASNKALVGQVKSLKAQSAEIKNRNATLSRELDSAKSANLKYNQKIVANSRIISEKDSAIEDLGTKLSETVAESTRLKNQVSDLDASVASLQERITAAEQVILNYQKAYADIYANALGVHLDDIPVTASTTVEQLQKAINSSTSTANVPVAPAILDDEDNDEASFVDFTNEDDIVIM